jgi:hypothetical protein
MRTFIPGHGLEEHVSTADDHGEDRRKNVHDIEREQCDSVRRVAQATGASAQRAAPAHAAPARHRAFAARARASSRRATSRPTACSLACRCSTSATAASPNSATTRCRASTSGSSSRSTRRTTRSGTRAGSSGASFSARRAPTWRSRLQGLALRPSEPGDTHADLVAKARKVLESWRRTSEPMFWTAVECYVRQQLVLAGNAGLPDALHRRGVSRAMPHEAVERAERSAHRRARPTPTATRSAPRPTMPSADIYRRLSQAVCRPPTARPRSPATLGRSDAAQIAITALFAIIENSAAR